MKSHRPLMQYLLLSLAAGLTACGGGGGDSGGETTSHPVTQTTPNATPPAGASQSGPALPPNDPPDDGGGQKPGDDPVPEDDPPPPPPLEAVCAASIDKCLDLGAASITRYLGGKSAAASYTFDDGYPTSSRIAEIFEQSGLRATFYIVPGTVEATTGWEFWRAIAGKGHEIGNHSLTHSIELNNPALSDETLEREINGAQTLIEQQLGIRTRTMAFPWHLHSARAMEIAKRNHFSVRRIDIGESNYEFAFFDLDHEPTLELVLARANAQLERVVKEAGWMVAGGHGVDGDGWSPVTSQFLRDHLAHASTFPSLWIETFEKVARYRACRPQLVPTLYTSAPGKAVLRLEGGYDGELCTDALTVRIPAKLAPPSGFRINTGTGKTIDAKVEGECLLVDLRPGDEITIEAILPPAQTSTVYR